MEIATIQREIDKNKRKIGLVYSADDIRANYEKGKMSALLTIEGPAGFDFDPELLESMFQAGFRISTLGWNESNVLTGSNQTGEGLTDLGREYVRNAQKLGILVDVSHISDAGFWDIMKITQAPVIASHSNSPGRLSPCPEPDGRYVPGHPGYGRAWQASISSRNSWGKSPRWTRSATIFFIFWKWIRSAVILRWAATWTGCDALAQGFEGVQSYPALAQRLLERGLTEEMVMNLYWNNALGVMDAAVRNNKK